MNKKKQKITGLSLLKDFFYFNHNKWIIGFSTVLFSCTFLYFFSFRRINVFPSGNNFKFESYNDSANGGKSEILQFNISDTSINLVFNLKQGFVSPYVGLSIKQKKDSLIDLSHYNLIHLNIEGQKIKNIGVSLYTLNPYKKYEVNSNDLCFHTFLEISPDSKQYYINLNQLKVPDWWCDLHHISPDKKIKPDLKHVLHLNIGTAYTPVLEAKCSLQIDSISFERNNVELIIFLTAAELIVIAVLIIIHYLRAKLRRYNKPITIAYKPIEINKQEQQLNNFLDYINNNFHENDLSLEQVSESTGINERRIANTIQENFGCNFKSYVNHIRINESKRLLKESDLNIGEIAFKVGFNNQSHFNRVFKSLVGTSPSAFRENIK